ncbi:MAG: outer membrane protein transport protein [Myxococcales bacterium]|nr:outer membrane protein transport protein [Myxococcales bacterium]MCB9520751.1 outer membrane protein transport protein [Myxococcales bacterium]MCB9533468.1 outer membrane protein transport protein [Myxococcales bacterium]
MTTPRALRPAAALVTLAIASPCLASGISVARFGGAHGNPTETNPYSLYYNPAGLAGVNGFELSLDVNWAQRNATYDRPAAVVGSQDETNIAVNSGEGSVSNFIYSPMIGFATDFGTDIPFGIALGFFAPFGGQSVWDEVDPVEGVPGAFDGPQRWYVTEGTIRTLAFTLAGGYEIEKIRLSLGLAANLYISEIDTIRARTVFGSDDIGSEGRSLVDASTTELGLGLGLLWEPVEDRLWVGFSYQSAPGFDGDQALEGDLINSFPPNAGEAEDTLITSHAPDILRLGVRYRANRASVDDAGTPEPLAEVRLFGDLTRWSRMTDQCILGGEAVDAANPHEYCAINSDGSLVTDDNVGIVQNLHRGWNDAAGFRLGGSYWVAPAAELQLDVGYDGNAIPDETLEPALMDFRKATLGIGGRFQVAKPLAIGILATNVFYFERDTSDVDTAEALVSPSRQPSSAGVYNQNVFLVNTNLDFTF